MSKKCRRCLKSNFFCCIIFFKGGIYIKLKIMYVKYPNIKIEKRNSAKIRGYFGNKFIENIEIHNHLDNKFLYAYPKVQYKTLQNTPFIIAIENSIPTLHNAIMQTEQIVIDNIAYNCDDIQIQLETKLLNISNKINKYTFLNPWLCLNQKNYEKYKNLDEDEKKIFLDKILIGNILSMCKGLNICVDNEIIVNTNVREVSSNFKNNKMVSFYGDFYTNFNIPNYFGIGKSVSRGFGMIKHIKEVE